MGVGAGPALGRRGGVWGRLDRCGCGWLFCARLAFRPASWCSLELCGFRRVGVGACVGVSRSVVVVHLSMWLRLGVGLALGSGRGVDLSHRRTRRPGESGARVVLGA